MELDADEILPADVDRATWLAARRSGLGGSDASAILGLSKYRCARDVYYDKVEGREQEPNEAMRWGQLLEATIRAEFTERTGITVVKAGLHRSRRHPWLLHSPDGFTGDDGLYEGKVARRAEDWEDGQVPDHAELQVQHGMACLGLGHAWVVGLLNAQRLVWRRVPRDQELIDKLERAEQTFWYFHVLAESPPPWGGSEAAAKTLAERFPNASGRSVELTAEEAVQLRAEYQRAKDNQAADEAAFREAQNAIRDRMGDAEFARVGGVDVFSWKQNGSAFDEKRFAAEHPDLYEEFTVKVDQLDVRALRDAHPAVHARFRNRVLRVHKGA